MSLFAEGINYIYTISNEQPQYAIDSERVLDLLDQPHVENGNPQSNIHHQEMKTAFNRFYDTVDQQQAEAASFPLPMINSRLK